MDLKQDPSTFGYMIQAALPLAAFLVFGLQKVHLSPLHSMRYLT